jgi:hypothetical protein
VGQAAHPAALVVTVFGHDVVGVDDGGIFFGVDLFDCVGGEVHRLVRVYSTSRRSLGFSVLTA